MRAQNNQKRLVVLSLTLCLIGYRSLMADETVDLILKADQHYLAGEFEKSADLYEQAIQSGAQSPLVFYNTACSSALAGRTDAAFRLLNAALDRGYNNVDHLKNDSDFKSLHADQRWAQAVQRCAGLHAEFLRSIKNPELRAELLEMMKADQEARSKVAQLPTADSTVDQHSPASQPGERRKEIPTAISNMMKVDAEHTARLKEIVAVHGWPTKSLVGADGANAAWLIAQHADADVQFQRHCLELMQKAPPGEVSRTDLAYMTDRVLVNVGKKQLYGTQFWLIDGKMEPRPIEDESNLDNRRREAGLSPMSKDPKQETHRTGNGESPSGNK